MGAFKFPYLRLSTALLWSAVACAVPVSAAADGNKMPPAAPSFHRNAPQAAPAQDGSRDTFVRRATSPDVPPSAAPLVGNVSRLTNTNGLSGASQYMAQTAGMSEPKNVNVPAVAFHAWLEKSHPNFASGAVRIAPGDIVCVKGAWDDSEKTLDKFGLPCKRIRSGELKTYPLEQVKVLIVDCAGEVPSESYQRIRDFVTKGGYLLSTDWSLEHCIQKCFPGYVEWNSKMNHTDIYPSEVVSPDPVLFKNTVSNANWKLDKESHLVSVLKPDTVRILVRSRELAREDGQGILAVSFHFGRGEVLHMVGHFDNNPSTFRFGDNLPDPAPIIGIGLRQALATNFITAGLANTHPPDR